MEILFRHIIFYPNKTFPWSDFASYTGKIKPELYGIGYIQKDLTGMTFTKGHDVNHLIITFNINQFDIDWIKYDVERILI